MPARLSVEELCSAMEQATDETATVSDYGPYVRVSVPIPEERDAYRRLLDVLPMADAWGSSDGNGEPRVWASVVKGDAS